MAKSPTNRLHSLWPSQSADGKPSVIPDARVFAEKLEPMIQNVGTAIAEHPRASLTVAATLGAIIGWFIKRK
jgi:ElaB/YqjD/DUF883 family membrane-anchored ribosome-binding protein